MLLCGLVIAAIGATAGFMMWHACEAAREGHLRAMDSMGIVLAEQTSRFVQVIELACCVMTARC
jgi:hypothetical protein